MYHIPVELIDYILSFCNIYDLAKCMLVNNMFYVLSQKLIKNKLTKLSQKTKAEQIIETSGGSLFGFYVELFLNHSVRRIVSAYITHDFCRSVIKHGTFKEWYRATNVNSFKPTFGVIRCVMNFDHNILSGPFKMWYKTGHQHSIRTYLNGNYHGKYWEWYKPACWRLKEDSEYYNGKINGHKKTWHENGQPHIYCYYAHGSILWYREWDQNGYEVFHGGVSRKN